MVAFDADALARWAFVGESSAFPKDGVAPASRTIVSPLDGRPIGDVPLCAPDDVAQAARRARAAQRVWAATPVHARARVADRFRGCGPTCPATSNGQPA